MEVRLKPDHVDAEGITTKKALKDMEYEIEEVSTGKIYEIDLKAPSLKEAKKKIDDMCRKLLANPIKDNYRAEVEEAE